MSAPSSPPFPLRAGHPMSEIEGMRELSGRRLYLDCDGVLADFDRAFEERFGHPPRAYEASHGPKVFWRNIKEEAPDFYRTLPLMPGARELFDSVAHLRPIILTGCPLGGWAEMQKLAWAAEHFPGTPMVTCMSKDKRLYCRPGDILVDDYLKYRHLWEEAGGVFIHHTGNVQETLSALRSRLASASPQADRERALEDALRLFYPGPCPVCSGDCGSANPPVISCPMQTARDALALASSPAPDEAAMRSAWPEGRYVIRESAHGGYELALRVADDDAAHKLAEIVSALWRGDGPDEAAMRERAAQRVRHKQRGTTYEVIGEAEVQASIAKSWDVPVLAITEGDKFVVYRSEADGKLWARTPEEFNDGRFEALPLSSSAPEGQSPLLGELTQRFPGFNWNAVTWYANGPFVHAADGEGTSAFFFEVANGNEGDRQALAEQLAALLNGAALTASRAAGKGEEVEPDVLEALRVISTMAHYEWSETREELQRIIDANREVAATAYAVALSSRQPKDEGAGEVDARGDIWERRAVDAASEAEEMRARAFAAEAVADQRGADLAEADAWIHEATKTITGLTASGSEYFGRRVRDVIRADLPFCAQRIRETRDGLVESFKQAVADRKAAEAERDTLASEVERLKVFGEKVNTIRNSIIGTQTINWSEHIYPLVAALNAAGFEGMDYPEAREYFGTMLERTNAAESRAEALAAQAAEQAGKIEAGAGILTDCAQILDVVKKEWGAAWSTWDQGVRDRLSSWLSSLRSAGETGDGR